MTSDEPKKIFSAATIDPSKLRTHVDAVVLALFDYQTWVTEHGFESIATAELLANDLCIACGPALMWLGAAWKYRETCSHEDRVLVSVVKEFQEAIDAILNGLPNDPDLTPEPGCYLRLSKDTPVTSYPPVILAQLKRVQSELTVPPPAIVLPKDPEVVFGSLLNVLGVSSANHFHEAPEVTTKAITSQLASEMASLVASITFDPLPLSAENLDALIKRGKAILAGEGEAPQAVDVPVPLVDEEYGTSPIAAAEVELNQPTGDEIKNANDPRDEWIYKRCCEGTKHGAIERELRKVASERKWVPLTGPNSIKAAARRYAERKRLPQPARRQGGRRAD